MTLSGLIECFRPVCLSCGKSFEEVGRLTETLYGPRCAVCRGEKPELAGVATTLPGELKEGVSDEND